jgi:hypothetical protein
VPFNSGSQALNWVASSSNYFAVGPDYYPQIDADNLVLYLEGNQIISYPTTGSTWYDLSGNTNNGTLINSPTFDSNGYFTFDGVDDYASINNNSNLVFGNGSFSVSIWIRTPITSSGEGTPSAWGPIVSKGCSTSAPAGTWWLAQNSTNTNRITFNISSTAGGTFVCALTTNTLSDGWHNIVATRSGSTSFLYQDSRLVATDTTSDSNLTSTSPLFIGTNTTSSPKYTNMALSQVSIYNKTLTAADVSQNYYGGPIVTGSISGSYQAGNLVSYAPGSTTTYNMAANIISGSLQNGVAFNPTNGGYWSFDGTDDRILLEGSTTNAWNLPSSINWTVTVWTRTTTTADGLGKGSIFCNSSGGPVASMMGVNAGVMTYWHYNGSWLQSSGTVIVNDGNWHMLTWVNFAGGTMNLYVDGGIDTAGVNSIVGGSNHLDLIGSSWLSNGYYQGDIASLQINNGKAFTASEVLQQYNATK